jgi:beta-galactosidase
VLLQIENEYGFYGTDKTYIEALRQIWYTWGINTDQYYVDTISNIKKSHWDGANIGINDGVTEEQYTNARSIEPNGMIFGGEIYSGWLTHWGEKFQGKDIARYTKEFEFLLKNNHSFSMYMVHGGTNFGLTAGANVKKEKGIEVYQGHITSYDYDAPINEQGSPNEKFTVFRDLAKKYLSWEIPEPPASLPTIEIPAFKPYKVAALFGNLLIPTIANTSYPPHFEHPSMKMLNQGIAVYQTDLKNNTYHFSVVPHDFMIVYLDDKFIGSYQRGKVDFSINCTDRCVLNILVEAMGHINFDHDMTNDRKGIYSYSVSVSSPALFWRVFTIDINEDISRWRILSSKPFPAISRATFNLTSVGDTYLNMENYKKGYIWVNGHLLGRYWNIGPSQKLFCPGVWLKPTDNSVTILELLTDETGEIRGDKTLK